MALSSAGLLTATLLSGCPSLREPPPHLQSDSGTAQPSVGAPARPAARPARQYRLGPASSALVSQAHTQANGGDFGLAAATLERAMRIEPDNPLLWIELGRVRLQQGNSSQAQSMGRKALASSTGDPNATAAAWRLIAEALRAQRRNQEAAEADRKASALAPH